MLTPPSNPEQPKQETPRESTTSSLDSFIGLFLLMVVFTCFVIAFLTLLGPAIGNVFSNIVVGI